MKFEIDVAFGDELRLCRWSFSHTAMTPGNNEGYSEKWKNSSGGRGERSPLVVDAVIPEEMFSSQIATAA